MDPHRRAEQRSLAFHDAVAQLLRREPQRIEVARSRVGEWLRNGSVAPYYAQAWEALLSGPRERLLATLVDPSEPARALRQVTPFAGYLAPEERWRIWRSVQ
jgi:hypothetical protein